MTSIDPQTPASDLMRSLTDTVGVLLHQELRKAQEEMTDKARQGRERRGHSFGSGSAGRSRGGHLRDIRRQTARWDHAAARGSRLHDGYVRRGSGRLGNVGDQRVALPSAPGTNSDDAKHPRRHRRRSPGSSSMIVSRLGCRFYGATTMLLPWVWTVIPDP